MSTSDAERQAILHAESGPNGKRRVWLRMTAEGGLTVEGQDLGDLSGFFDDDIHEYKWAFSVGAQDVPALVSALNGDPDADPFDYVRSCFSGVRHSEFQAFCETNSIPIRFWSRFGD